MTFVNSKPTPEQLKAQGCIDSVRKYQLLLNSSGVLPKGVREQYHQRIRVARRMISSFRKTATQR